MFFIWTGEVVTWRIDRNRYAEKINIKIYQDELKIYCVYVCYTNQIEKERNSNNLKLSWPDLNMQGAQEKKKEGNEDTLALSNY